MSTDNALPNTADVADVAGDQHTADAADLPEQASGQPEGETEPKTEDDGKTPRERELERERRKLERRIDSRTRRLAQMEAELAQYRAAQPRQPVDSFSQSADGGTIENDDDVVRIPRRELPRLIEQAQRQTSEQQRMHQAAQSLKQALGADFDAITDDLHQMLGEQSLSVLEADDPAAVARYLTDPDNADEAERIARLTPIQQGKALARIEAKIAEAKAKPQPSKAAAPLTPAKGAGSADLNNRAPTSMADYMAWANKQYTR